jgi:hypothetical protein
VRIERVCDESLSRPARRVATFDDDFAIYPFGPERARAFEIVR